MTRPGLFISIQSYGLNPLDRLEGFGAVVSLYVLVASRLAPVRKPDELAGPATHAPEPDLPVST
jgi:hypothetical protein